MAETPAGPIAPAPAMVDPPLPGVSKEKVLWHIGLPPDAGDSTERDFVNGFSRHDDAFIPGVRCGTCKDGVYFGHPRVLSYECPPELRPLLRDSWPLPRKEWDRLVSKFNAHNERLGRRSVIEPGCTFPHFKWKVPSRPDGDVFWPFMAPPIVSARLRGLLEPHKLEGVSFYRVRIEYAGVLDPNTRPLPQVVVDGWFEKCPRMETAMTNQLEFYSCVVPTAPKTMILCDNFCPECKEVQAGEATQEYERRSRYWEKHRTNKTIPRHATLDTDLFEAWPFQGFIASERAATILKSLKLGNIAISEIEVLDETPEQSFRQLLLEEERAR